MLYAAFHFSRYRRHASALLFCVVVLLGGCLSPVDVGDHPVLSQIQKDFDEVVAEIHARPDEKWYADWYGNVFANTKNKGRGLCWHWQEAVWSGMKRRVDKLNWSAVGVVLNGGQMLEHHAVLVFDPKVIPMDEILTRKPPCPVWVLDAWRHGKPEIYKLDPWLKWGAILANSSALEDLSHVPLQE